MTQDRSDLNKPGPVLSHSLRSAADDASALPGLAGLVQAIPPPGGRLRQAPPVELWNPPDCGDIDLRITSDGRWLYQGTIIARPALVRLFASVLKREGERFVLVTPVEKLGITVEDAPFQAVDMAVDGAGRGRIVSVRTDMDDVVSVGPDHPLRFASDARGGVKPYVHIRRDLWARFTRALAHDLLALVETAEDGTLPGLFAAGRFWAIDPTGEPHP